MIRHAAIAVSALLIAAPALAEPAPVQGPATITLRFDTSATTGKVMVALFNSESAYSGDRAVAQTMVNVEAGQRTAVFADLPAGDYAAKIFHDVNSDGRMNTNPFGMPTEPYAFSNNARGNMGPARWDRARFNAAGPVSQTITLR